MEFVKILALRGPNIWAYFPVIEAWVDLGDLKDSPSDSIPGFSERLMNWLPGMIEHRCSVGERGGFFERLRRGTYPAHILEHVTIELQTLAGSPVGYGRARESSTEGIYKVVVKYKDETLARECLAAARELVLAAIYDRPFDLATAVAHLRGIARQNLLDPGTDAIVQAARRRNIPFLRMNTGNLVQLGTGSRQRRILGSGTGQTGVVAESIARDEVLARDLLDSAGLPVTRCYPVLNEADAWETTEYIGLPVTLRPRNGVEGLGATAHLFTREQVDAAYQRALQVDATVLMERTITGNRYRLLVVGGRLVAAAQCQPAQVTGDGVATIRALVERENRSTRRCGDGEAGLCQIPLDELSLAVLADQGFTPESVADAGATVLVRRDADLDTGGTAIDVTDLVAPVTAQQAALAAQIVGLDVAGIDVIASDISAPLESQGGRMVGVHASPCLRIHLTPTEGEPRPVGEAIVDMIFAPGDTGRIPIAAVTGTNGKTTVSRFLAHLLQRPGTSVGLTCTDGIYLDGQRIVAGDCSGPTSARNLLMHPRVDVAVLETARGGILRAGLAFNECQVAVVTNIGEGDHLGISDMNTPEDLARVKCGIVELVSQRGAAVLNAADPLVAGMAAKCPGPVIYFAADPANLVIQEHLAAGGRAVFVRAGQLVLASGATEDALLPIHEVPVTQGGRIAFEVENTLAATAAAWGMDVSREAIADGLRTFASDLEKVPSRFNVMEYRGATVIVDYGHNSHALRALIDALQAFPQTRRVAVFSSSGDRRDADIVLMGQLLGAGFDRVILYEDNDLYRRKPGEITTLLRQGLAGAARTSEIEYVDGGLNALEHALRTVQPGELLVAQAHLSDPTVRFLKQFLAQPEAGGN
ncbi:MAG: cyanophycin synthetase [Bryobacterales bacterium]|nr:cyanophycin synthetase [Bryobacterales bacterium]